MRAGSKAIVLSHRTIQESSRRTHVDAPMCQTPNRAPSAEWPVDDDDFSSRTASLVGSWRMKETRVVLHNERPPSRLIWRLVKVALFLGVIGTLAVAAAGSVLFVVYSRDLPEFNDVGQYRPKLATK